MSRNTPLVLLWAGASTLACVFALSWLPAAFDGDAYYPIGADSFYHARRILDTVADHEAYYEFDNLIHAPDGSMLTWPWAYDRVAAAIVRGVMAVSGSADPMAILAYVPVGAVPLNVALVVALGLLAGLPRWGVGLLACAYSVSPLTRELHAVGRIDHHYVEHLFFLASLVAGMTFLGAPSRARAVILGVVLGIAPAFHNGLFVLQAFFGAAVFVLWARGLLEIDRVSVYFAAALALATLAILLPSEPFQRFEWAFYHLGWFHLLTALLTGGAVWWLSGHASQLRNILGFIAVVTVLAWIAWGQIGHGGRYVFAELPALRDVTESQSLIAAVVAGEAWDLTLRYSVVVWLLPVIGVGLALVTLRSTAPHQVLLAVTLLGGGFLMLQQLRLHNFGSLILILPLLQWLARGAVHNTAKLRALAIGAGVCFVAAQIPAVASLGTYPELAGDRNYAINRALIATLGQRCEAEPGVVLARFGDGHYLRYHTACAVIANNMIMTPQHIERIALTEAMFTMTAAQLRESHRWVDYVYLWREDNPLDTQAEATVVLDNSRLILDLLLSANIPVGFELIGETAFELPDSTRIVFARAFRITH